MVASLFKMSVEFELSSTHTECSKVVSSSRASYHHAIVQKGPPPSLRFRGPHRSNGANPHYSVVPTR